MKILKNNKEIVYIFMLCSRLGSKREGKKRKMEKFLSGAAFTMYFEHLRVPNEEHIVRDERTDTEFAIAKKKTKEKNLNEKY